MASTHPKVVMVISQFFPERGGAEVQAQLLAGALRARGAQVTVLTRRLKGLPKRAVIDGIPVYRAIRTVPLPFLWGLAFMVSTFIFLFRKRNEYDLIHCHIMHEFQTVVAVAIKYLFRKKVVVKMSSSGMTSDIRLILEKVYGKLFLRLAKGVDAVIAVCRESSQELRTAGFPAGRLVEIANGVDTASFIPVPSREVPEERIITFIGRLDGFKGVDDLLHGFKVLLAKKESVRLVIVGTGPLESQFKELAGTLHLKERVTFKGKQNSIVAELHNTDVFVLPSRSEGMSNVLLEAMACGVPIVATAVGGNTDLISDRRNGILVPPSDPDALGEALGELLLNGALAEQLGSRARKTVEEHYTLEMIADRYLNLYNRLAPASVRAVPGRAERSEVSVR